MKDYLAKALSGVKSIVSIAQRDSQNIMKMYTRYIPEPMRQEILAGALAGILSLIIKDRAQVSQQTEITLDTRYISDQDRQYVLKRDDYRCVRCGSQSFLELDHIIPLSKGGATSARNLQILCRNCNRKKGLS